MFASNTTAQYSNPKDTNSRDTNPRGTNLRRSYNASRRRFIRTTASGMVIAATLPSLAGCESPGSAPDSAIEAWSPSELGDSIIRWGLSYGILAPNPHNMQPWLVDLSSPDELLVFLDPTRLLPETDPLGRQIIIGTGSMLGVFELALASKGYAVDIEWIADSEELTPTVLETQQPIVRVRVFEQSEKTKAINEVSLFEQVLNRRTVRANYDLNRQPSQEFVSSVSTLNSAGQHAGVVDRKEHSHSFNKISNWVKEAWRIELSTPRTSLESMQLLRIGREEINLHRDGIAIESTFLWLMSKLGLLDRNEPLAVGSSGYTRQIEEFNQAVDSTPSWFYITSDTNSRSNQLAVGRTYVFAQLRAAELGLVMHPLSQGLQEYSEMTEIKNKVTTEFNQVTSQSDQTVQILARIGYLPSGIEPPKPAPRRGLGWHIMSA